MNDSESNKKNLNELDNGLESEKRRKSPNIPEKNY
jgi:hypothetical protein